MTEEILFVGGPFDGQSRLHPALATEIEVSDIPSIGLIDEPLTPGPIREHLANVGRYRRRCNCEPTMFDWQGWG